MRGWLVALAVVAAMPSPALAQDGEAPLTPEQIAQMCSARGAFQYDFGQTGVPGSSRLESDIGRGLALPDTYAPFTKAQPRSTEWSGKFMEMAYTYHELDEEAAWTVIDAIAGELEGLGWTPVDMPFEKAPIYLMGYGGETLFQTIPAGADAKQRVLLSLDYSLGEVSLTCGRDDLLRAHADEAFGELPEGTPRPTVPEIAVPVIRNEADCDDPAIAAQVRAMLDNGGADDFTAVMIARTKWRDRLTSWMLWKLDKSGKIKPDELIKLSFSSIGDASPGGDPFATFGMLEELFPVLDGVAKAEEAKDTAALCRSFIPFHAWIAKIDAITLKQTEAVQARLTAEAKRLGVSFD